jgi:hypothetical protein
MKLNIKHLQSSAGLYYHFTRWYLRFFLICQPQWLTSYIDSRMFDLVNRKSTGSSNALIQNLVSKICMSFLSYNNNKQNQLITSFWSWITCMFTFSLNFKYTKKKIAKHFQPFSFIMPSFTCMYIVICGNNKKCPTVHPCITLSHDLWFKNFFPS